MSFLVFCLIKWFVVFNFIFLGLVFIIVFFNKIELFIELIRVVNLIVLFFVRVVYLVIGIWYLFLSL